MNKKDALVAGENLSDQFKYHVLDVSGPPMIHVTHNRLPEIVLFGKEQNFLTPISVNAGNQIMINGKNSKEITVSKFAVKEADQKRIVSTKVDEVIRAVVELGGTYPDVVQMLQEAKASGALASRFEIDAIPEAGRTYRAHCRQRGQFRRSKMTQKTGQRRLPAVLLPIYSTKRGIARHPKMGAMTQKHRKMTPQMRNPMKKQVPPRVSLVKCLDSPQRSKGIGTKDVGKVMIRAQG